jgi:hypothetical protein
MPELAADEKTKVVKATHGPEVNQAIRRIDELLIALAKDQRLVSAANAINLDPAHEMSDNNNGNYGSIDAVESDLQLDSSIETMDYHLRQLMSLRGKIHSMREPATNAAIDAALGRSLSIIATASRVSLRAQRYRQSAKRGTAHLDELIAPSNGTSQKTQEQKLNSQNETRCETVETGESCHLSASERSVRLQDASGKIKTLSINWDKAIGEAKIAALLMKIETKGAAQVVTYALGSVFESIPLGKHAMKLATVFKDRKDEKDLVGQQSGVKAMLEEFAAKKDSLVVGLESQLLKLDDLDLQAFASGKMVMSQEMIAATISREVSRFSQTVNPIKDNGPFRTSTLAMYVVEGQHRALALCRQHPGGFEFVDWVDDDLVSFAVARQMHQFGAVRDVRASDLQSTRVQNWATHAKQQQGTL